MFKQTAIGLTCFLLGILGGMGAIGHSQVYVGGSLGNAHQYGIGNQPDGGSHSQCSSTYEKQHQPVGAAFLGYRFKYVGAEIGSGTLFHSSFGGDCPWSLGTQDVKASYRYARLNGYIPLPGGFDLVPFIGRAFVKFTNYEVQDYRAPYLEPEHATNLTTGQRVSPLFGVGVEKRLGDWMVRVEAQQVNKVAEDYWTARGFHNTVQTVSFGIGRYF